MAYNPATVHEFPDLALESREAEIVVLPTPLVEKVGMLAIMHSDNSRRISFTTGAVGHTQAQVHIEGRLAGPVARHVSVMLPKHQGNVLVIPRPALVDTSLELMRHGQSSVKFNGEHLLKGVMRVLADREFDGVRYNAAISYFDDPIKRAEEIVYATTGSQDIVTLYIPHPNPLPSQHAIATDL
jgi:hypothetical protein